MQVLTSMKLLQTRVALTFALLVVGCDVQQGSSDNVQTQTNGPADVVQGESQPSTPPFFELGRNVTGKNTPKYYTPINEGDELEVELGPQGLWMVVLAFKTQAMLSAPLFLSGSIEVEDHEAFGSMKLKKQKVFPGGDGFDYYYNFWLVVKLPTGSFPYGVSGNKASINFEVQSNDGSVHQLIRSVTLIGGP